MKIKNTLHKLNLFLLIITSLILVACSEQETTQQEPTSKEYFVAKNGSDENDGSETSPFLTINKAAQIAMPGDTVTVREGVYREWIKPARGGESEELRITYQAAEGQDVRILGSEKATDWQKQENGTWLFSTPETFFGDLNPFNTLSRHPIPVKQDEAGDGWGWLKYGRWTHLGDVIINGEGLTEKQTLEEVVDTPLTWYSETKEGTTSIWANFSETDPNAAEVEINSRGYAFFPEKSGLNYITFKGFTVLNVASHWAPPVPYQPAAIGSNGGNHWVIENNIVMYAKAACISIGVPTGEADEDASGYHIIRNNVLIRCGQAGVMGQSWNSHSQVYGNHIESVNYREEFGGWETAAIKHHNGEGLVIRDNFIRNVHTFDPEIGAAHGIWNDFDNTNWRVSNNIVIGSEANAILTEANPDGPSLYENNIFIGGHIATYSSRGDAWAHNLFVNAPNKWENQQWGDRPKIGDDRWVNNFFVSEGLDPKIESENSSYSNNVFVNWAKPHPDGKNTVALPELDIQLKVNETETGVSLVFTIDDEELSKHTSPIVNAEILNLTFSYDPTVNKDFFGNARTEESNAPGPFVKLQPGENEFVIYEYPPLYKKAMSLIGEVN